MGISVVDDSMVDMHLVSGLQILKILRATAVTPVVLVTGLPSHDPIVLECCKSRLSQQARDA